MQVGPDDFFHLTYCTNVHPGENWDETFQSLKEHLPPLKARLAPERPFGVGLRLSNQAAHELLQGARLERFRDWLREERLYVFTMNGFPYGAFHGQRVKDQVHVPDWREPERVRYTVRLAEILNALLPQDVDGSISTSPLSYKPWLDEGEYEAVFRESSRHLAGLVGELIHLEARSGKLIHVDLEPEPDALLENTKETVDFFSEWLLPEGAPYLADRFGLSREEAEERLRRHVRVCYDTCHFAVEYEEPHEVLRALQENGIQVGKIQLSAALKAALSEEVEERRAVGEQLRPFAEHIYLHQVVERRGDDALHHYNDLPEALDRLENEEAREWRIHYHVPLFADHYASLASTQEDITKTLDVVLPARSCAHLEIETYTWEVLPPELKVDLTQSIAREYEWVLQKIRG